MHVAFVNCTVLADYYTCRVHSLPLQTTPAYDPDVLARMHTVVLSVVCLIGVSMVAGFVVCLVCTRGTSERMMNNSAKKDDERASLPGLSAMSAAHAVLHPMLFTALARGECAMADDTVAGGKDSPGYFIGPPTSHHRHQRVLAVQASTDSDDDEFFGSRTSFHSECSLPAGGLHDAGGLAIPANTDVMLYGCQASRL